MTYAYVGGDGGVRRGGRREARGAVRGMRAGVRARDLGNRVSREKPGRAGAVVAGMDRKRRGLASSVRLSSRVPVGVFTNDAAHRDDDDGRERGSVSKREDRRERDVPGADEAFRLMRKQLATLGVDAVIKVRIMENRNYEGVVVLFD